MRRLLTFTLLTGILAVAATSLAAQAKTPATAPKTTPASAPAPTMAAKPAAKPTATWASGKIGRYDAQSKTLVINQGTHEMTFALAADVKVVEGKKNLQLNDLSADTGRSVRVRYTEANGTKTAARLEVSPAPKTPAKR